MRRALLKQIAFEWNTNIWLVIELAVVTIAIWAIFMFLWMMCKGLFQPRGFTPERVYSLTVKFIPQTSPYYIEDAKESSYEDMMELLRRLKNNPYVESASLHNNFSPYEHNYTGNGYSIEGFPDSTAYTYSANTRIGQPDIIKVLDIKSLTGKSQEEMVSMLERGEVLISPNQKYEENIGSVKDLIGRNFYFHENEDYKWKVGDVVEAVRRDDYEIPWEGVIIMPFGDYYTGKWGDFIFKLKDGKEDKFINEFQKNTSLSSLRNVYLTDLKSLVRKGESVQKEIEITLRLMTVVTIFLLITIFLGLLGSFWFRVQQRISEIAIRKTFGAKNTDLFRRIIGEGLFLLLFGVMMASGCVWPFIDSIKEYTDEQWYTILSIEGITIVLMAMGVVLSLWYPAWRAMQIEPAIAVKDE